MRLPAPHAGLPLNQRMCSVGSALSPKATPWAMKAAGKHPATFTCGEQEKPGCSPNPISTSVSVHLDDCLKCASELVGEWSSCVLKSHHKDQRQLRQVTGTWPLRALQMPLPPTERNPTRGQTPPSTARIPTTVSCSSPWDRGPRCRAQAALPQPRTSRTPTGASRPGTPFPPA